MKVGNTDLYCLVSISVFVWLDVWVRVEITCSVTHSRQSTESQKVTITLENQQTGVVRLSQHSNE